MGVSYHFQSTEFDVCGDATDAQVNVHICEAVPASVAELRNHPEVLLATWPGAHLYMSRAIARELGKAAERADMADQHEADEADTARPAEGVTFTDDTGTADLPLGDVLELVQGYESQTPRPRTLDCTMGAHDQCAGRFQGAGRTGEACECECHVRGGRRGGRDWFVRLEDPVARWHPVPGTTSAADVAG